MSFTLQLEEGEPCYELLIVDTSLYVTQLIERLSFTLQLEEGEIDIRWSSFKGCAAQKLREKQMAQQESL